MNIFSKLFIKPKQKHRLTAQEEKLIFHLENKPCTIYNLQQKGIKNPHAVILHCRQKGYTIVSNNGKYKLGDHND